MIHSRQFPGRTGRKYSLCGHSPSKIQLCRSRREEAQIFPRKKGEVRASSRRLLHFKRAAKVEYWSTTDSFFPAYFLTCTFNELDPSTNCRPPGCIISSMLRPKRRVAKRV